MSKSDFVKKFDSIFRTKFHKLDEVHINELIKKTKAKLEITNSSPLNLLLVLSYIYLEKRGFTADNQETVKKLDEKQLSEIKSLFRKPLISEPAKSDFLLIVTKKTEKEVDGDDIEKLAKVYKGSDIIYLDKKTMKITYTRGDATTKIRKLVKDEKIVPMPIHAVSITFDPFDKLLTSPKLDIFEVEFRSVNLSSLRGLYIKAGSKQDTINKKIGDIRNSLLDKSVLRVSNLKSIHVGLKGCDRKESASLIVTIPKKLGVYKIKWKSKAPEDLDDLIRIDLLKGLFDIEVMDGNIPYIELITTYFLNKKNISNEDYNTNIQPQLSKWDKYSLLRYDSKSIKPNYLKLDEAIKQILGKDYAISKFSIKLKPKERKNGLLLKNNKSGKEVFLYLNKRNTKKETIDKLINNDMPILIVDFASNIINQPKRINFLRINEGGPASLTEKIEDICNHGKFYRNQRERFLRRDKILDNIHNELGKKKTSQGIGSFWEEVCEDILDYIFNRSFKLSGKDFPDGRTYWHSGNEGFLWDSKGLMKTNLKESIITKDKKPKDIAYVKVFSKKMSLDYYVYLSCGVTKKEFEEAMQILDKYKPKIKFSCITENAIKDLKNIFLDEARASMLHKNNVFLVNNIKKIFDRGFVDSINLNELTEGMENEDSLNTQEARASVRKEKEKLIPVPNNSGESTEY